MQSIKKTVIISSVATGDFAIRRVIKSFGGEKVIAVHGPIDEVDDEQMKLEITRNVARIRSLLDVTELVAPLYDFYGNVKRFNTILDEHPDYRIVADITGGDKSVSDALLYSCLLSRRNDIVIVYVKRSEHSDGSTTDIIQLPPAPCLTDRQRDIMEKIGDGSTIGDISDATGTSRQNAWNYVNSLLEIGLVKVEKGTERVTPAYPGNVYSKE